MNIERKNFAFWGGEKVRLLRPIPGRGVTTEDIGIVWGVYSTTPPSYEATFTTQNGVDREMSFHEEEEYWFRALITSTNFSSDE